LAARGRVRHAARGAWHPRPRPPDALRGAADRTLLLASDRLAAQAAELSASLGIDWLRDPFSRCLLCNVALRPAPPLARAALPPQVREAFDAINQCPQCGRLYWAGGHVRRMRQRLERWKNADFA
jgi:uncharacterized protein with PIN domain